MTKYTMIFTLLSLLPIMSLQSECSICLSQDLPNNDDNNETAIRGQKCKCFCSLTVAEDATIGNNLTVDGDLTGGNITAPGGRVDGELLVNGSDVNTLFNIAQYFFIPETTRACTAPSQSVARNAAISFPTGTVSTSSCRACKECFTQTSATTFNITNCSSGTSSYPNNGTLTFTAVIQFDASTTNAKISAVGTDLGGFVNQIATVTQPSGQSQITIMGSYNPIKTNFRLAKIQFINKSTSSVCITSANVTFKNGLFYIYNPPSPIGQ